MRCAKRSRAPRTPTGRRCRTDANRADYRSFIKARPRSSGLTSAGTSYDRWSRQLYHAGVEIALSRTWRIEPYLACQNNGVSASGNARRLGLVLKFYR